MATSFRRVFVSVLQESGVNKRKYEFPVTVTVENAKPSSRLKFFKDNTSILLDEFTLNSSNVEVSRIGQAGVLVSLTTSNESKLTHRGEGDSNSSMEAFDNEANLLLFARPLDANNFHSIAVKHTRDGVSGSVFTQRTDEASATQYFQFYGYLSQQQNMMQDYVRTSTYQRAILANLSDFKGKVVMDVGAGSGILSFFALQAGAAKVYAVEASSMAQHAEELFRSNKMQSKAVVIYGKIEEIEIPEKVDVIISEPMGYMLFNERMLETYLHAKKWLAPNGKMFPSQGDLHVAPFSDDNLYAEQFAKANFWYQQSFHGVDLTHLRNAAMKEYFRQPIVDTFDIRICMAKSIKHMVNFQTADETDLHRIEIPLSFQLNQSGTVHGLAFWFDVAFIGSTQTIWLSTAPHEALTHWYQVRCLLETPIFVKEGQTLKGSVVLNANKRQSYDVEIELGVEATGARSYNTLDLKNPYFRYTGQPVQAPPGQSTQSPSEQYWTQLDTSRTQHGQPAINGSATMMNGSSEMDESGVHQLLVNSNLVVNNHQGGGPVNSQVTLVAGIAGLGNDTLSRQGRMAVQNQQRSMVNVTGAPTMFSQHQQSVVMGNTSHYPVSTNFMIGDYVTPGNVLLPNQGIQQSTYSW